MRSHYVSGRALLGIVLLVGGFFTGGCTTYREEFMRENMTGGEAPSWTQGDFQNAYPNASDDVFFIGRSIGYDVLDEAAAVTAAREDVYRQLVQMVNTQVHIKGGFGDSRWNTETDFGTVDNRYLPDDKLQQQIYREAVQFATGLAGELIDRDVYFEQWEVRKKRWILFIPQKANAVRYKCWLLVSIPKHKLQARIDEFRQYVKAAYDRWLEDRERAIEWTKEDRLRRIARDTERLKQIRHDQLEEREEARAIRKSWARNLMGVRYNVQCDD